MINWVTEITNNINDSSTNPFPCQSETLTGDTEPLSAYSQILDKADQCIMVYKLKIYNCTQGLIGEPPFGMYSNEQYT